MSYNVQLKWSGESASGDRGTRVYTVVSTTNTDTAIQIQRLPQIPNVGSIHPSNFWLRVKDRPDVKRLAPYYWEVTVNYEWAFDAAQDPDQRTPLDEPTIIRFGFVGGDEPIDVDADGLPIINSANEVFDPGISIPTNDWYVELVRNEPTFNGNIALQYKDVVNSDPFLSLPAGTWKIRGIEAEQQVFGESLIYWRVTYTIDGRRTQASSYIVGAGTGVARYTLTADTPPWYRRVRNIGLYQLDGGNPVRITDGQGNAISVPVPLELDGTQRSDTENPIYLSYKVYNELPYAPLGLP